MPDWVSRITEQLSPPPRLFFLADLDRLLEAPELRAALAAGGFTLVAYDDPLEFRYRFEAELWPRLLDRGGEGQGAVVAVGSRPRRAIPADLLAEGVYLEIGFQQLFPLLNAVALGDLPREHLDRLAAAYALYSGETLGEKGTREFLLRDVYGLLPVALASREAFVAYLLRRHYAGDMLPASLDQLLAERLGPQLRLDAEAFDLLRRPEVFFRWLQTAWDGYVQPPTATALREAAVSFEAPAIRPYLGNLFGEGQLSRVRLQADVVPGWMRPGVILPGDDPVRDFADALGALDGAWPALAAGYRDWLAFAWRWAALRSRVAGLPDAVSTAARLLPVQAGLEAAFDHWLRARYAGLASLAVTTTPVLVHQIAGVLRRALEGEERIALLVVDGLALDHWCTLRAYLPLDDWEVQEGACFAWIPTLTPISRQAIFAGRVPYYFPDSWATTAREEAHWRRLGADWGLEPGAVRYNKLTGAAGAELDWLADPGLRLVGLVLDDIDELGHSQRLGLAGMQRCLCTWAAQGRLRSVVEALLAAGILVYLTADHGSIEAVGQGQPREGVLVKQRSHRARLYRQESFALETVNDYPAAAIWPPIDLPPGLHVVVAAGQSAFAASGAAVVAHGGIALEEVVVPFIRIGRRA